MQESDARERALHASLYICRYDRCRYDRLDLITVNLTYLHIWPVTPRSDRSDRSARSAQNDRNTPLWTWALYGLNSYRKLSENNKMNVAKLSDFPTNSPHLKVELGSDLVWLMSESLSATAVLTKIVHLTFWCSSQQQHVHPMLRS